MSRPIPPDMLDALRQYQDAVNDHLQQLLSTPPTYDKTLDGMVVGFLSSQYDQITEVLGVESGAL